MNAQNVSSIHGRPVGLTGSVTVRSVAAVVGQVAWGVVRWLWRHRRYTLAFLSLGFVAWLVGWDRGMVYAALAVLAPATVCAIWSTARPHSYERFVAGPSRRLGWRLWVRRTWPVLARECGLSVQRQDAKGKAIWIAPSLMRLDVVGWTIRVRIRARVGQTVRDLQGAVAALGTAAGAVSWRATSNAPSTVDVVLQMADPLAGTRPAAIATGNGLDIVAGRVDDGTELVVDVADPWHLAIQGMTRSGKSVLTYTLLASLAGRHDAVVCGLDPTGILLGPWGPMTDWYLRHCGTSNIPAAGDVVDRIVAVMDQRIAWLMAEGLDKMPNPSPDLPVLVVVLEEYPGMLAAAEADDIAASRKPGQRIAPRIRAGVRRLVQEGAKAGVRVLLLAQRMDASIVGGAERSNLGTRISLRVDNADAVRMLHSDVDADLVHDLAGADPGRGVIETPGQPLRWFKADLLTYRDYLTAVRQHAPIVDAEPTLALVQDDAGTEDHQRGDDAA